MARVRFTKRSGLGVAWRKLTTQEWTKSATCFGADSNHQNHKQANTNYIRLPIISDKNILKNRSCSAGSASWRPFSWLFNVRNEYRYPAFCQSCTAKVFIEKEPVNKNKNLPLQRPLMQNWTQNHSLHTFLLDNECCKHQWRLWTVLRRPKHCCLSSAVLGQKLKWKGVQ